MFIGREDELNQIRDVLAAPGKSALGYFYFT